MALQYMSKSFKLWYVLQKVDKYTKSLLQTKKKSENLLYMKR